MGAGASSDVTLHSVRPKDVLLLRHIGPRFVERNGLPSLTDMPHGVCIGFLAAPYTVNAATRKLDETRAGPEY